MKITRRKHPDHLVDSCKRSVTEISVRVKSVRPLDTKTGPAGQNLVDQV